MALVLNDRRQLTDLMLSSIAMYNIALDGSVPFGAKLKHNLACQGGERTLLSMYVLEDLLKQRIGVIAFNKAVAKIGVHRRASKSYPSTMCWKVDITDVC